MTTGHLGPREDLVDPRDRPGQVIPQLRQDHGEAVPGHLLGLEVVDGGSDTRVHVVHHQILDQILVDEVVAIYVALEGCTTGISYIGSQQIVARGATGEVVRTFDGKERVSISEDGRYWGIEGPGEPIPGEQEPTPTLWILDNDSGEQTKLDDIYGFDFQWYDAAPGYCSFLLWGMENKKFNPNVVLTDLGPFLRSMGD